jgi:hypothetical protein
MKYIAKNILVAVLLLAGIAFLLPGCYETHYYHRYHHHTRGWYDRNHMPPPAGVDFNVDVR